MALMQQLQNLIAEKLTAAAVEISGAVEDTVSEVQGDVSLWKEENDRLRRMLSIRFKPEMKLDETDSPHSPGTMAATSEPRSTESPGPACGSPAQSSTQQGPEMVPVKLEDCSQTLAERKEEEEEVVEKGEPMKEDGGGGEESAEKDLDGPAVTGRGRTRRGPGPERKRKRMADP